MLRTQLVEKQLHTLTLDKSILLNDLIGSHEIIVTYFDTVQHGLLWCAMLIARSFRATTLLPSMSKWLIDVTCVTPGGAVGPIHGVHSPRWAPGSPPPG